MWCNTYNVWVSDIDEIIGCDNLECDGECKCCEDCKEINPKNG